MDGLITILHHGYIRDGINRRCMLLCGSYNSDEENQENTNGTGTKECGIERKQMPPGNEGAKL